MNLGLIKVTHELNCFASSLLTEMSKRIRSLRYVAELGVRPRISMASHGPTPRRFHTITARRTQTESHAAGSHRSVNKTAWSVIIASLTGLAGYGISRLSTNTNKPTSTLSILDAERLPEVQYATLQDMRKASSSLLHLIPDLYTQRGIPSTSLTDHWI